MVYLDWSNFKPEFSGKPDEDAETHLLHTNDWMRDLEQLQQMLNLEAEEQTHLLTNRQSSPMGNYRTSPLNL